MRSEPPSSLRPDDAGSDRVAGRYRVVGVLGSGGSAEVLRVVDEATGQQLALKRLRASLGAKAAALFELEYQTLASLKHPRIVEAFDYGRDEAGAGFYTMELLAGDDLKSRAPVPFLEASAYLRDAAQALGVIHARQLVHRDVSPRNLWRTPDGRVKLIDFGALVPFGSVDQVVGTPPCVPPEALRGEALDQRADLYALGAVGYFLLTGQHAFAARDVRELPALWQEGFAPASKLVAARARADLPPVPAALEQLIGALLQPERLARPSSAEELIDRLVTRVGVPHAQRDDAPVVRLANSAFVGRERERRRLRRLLTLARSGHGQAAVIEGETGAGRTRLLSELGLEAQVALTTVLRVDTASSSGLYGTAGAIAFKLLMALPQVARAGAEPYAGVLAHLSPRVRERLGTSPAEIPDALDLRVRVQAALCGWVLSIARTHPLVLLVDGLEQIDEASAAFLLALVGGLARARLFVVCTLQHERGRKIPPGERAIVQGSRRLTLGALSESDLRALLRSIFGDAEHLGRLASRLHQAARGNPGYTLELAHQLVHRGFVRVDGGTWVLPRELPAESLASSHEHALIARLELLSRGAGELAAVLSVPTGALTLELAKQLADSVSDGLYAHLDELMEWDVLMREGDCVRFVHAQVRAVVRGRLPPSRRERVARVLGEALLARPEADPQTRLAAGLHLLEGGDSRGAGIVARESVLLALHHHDRLRVSLPLLEAALEMLRGAGRRDGELVSLIVPLAMAGYYRDLRYAERYGDTGLQVLSELLELDRAKRLARLLGPRLGALSALTLAYVRLRRRRDPLLPSFRDALLLLFNCVATLTAASALVLDAPTGLRRAATLAPLAALGRKGLLGFMHEFCTTMAMTVQDTGGSGFARLEKIIARLDRGDGIRGMPESMRTRYLGGALYVYGLMQGLQDGDAALRTAERLDGLGLFYEMSADQVRMMHFGNQGAHAAFGEAQRRVEQHAIQHGTTAIVETWTLSMLIGISLRLHDVLGLKRVSQQLSRLGRKVPLMEPVAQRGRGAYLLLHDQYREALPELEGCLDEPPRGRSGWCRMVATLAHAYNKLGEHARALAVCDRAVALIDERDLVFTALYLKPQTERLVALAGLGRRAEAQASLAALLARHAPQRGPLTLGEIHEAGVEIALLVHDDVAAGNHLSETERWYLATGVPSLVQHCKDLRRRVQHILLPRRTSEPWAASTGGSVDGIREIERELAGGTLSLRERARLALALLLRHSGATHGAIYLLESASTMRLLAAEPDVASSPALAAWVQRRLARELEDDVTQGMDATIRNDPLEPDTHACDGVVYRSAALIGAGPRGNGIIGLCLLGATASEAPSCPGALMAAVGYQLAAAQQRDALLSAEQTWT